MIIGKISIHIFNFTCLSILNIQIRNYRHIFDKDDAIFSVRIFFSLKFYDIYKMILTMAIRNESLKKIYVYAFYVFSFSFHLDPLNDAFDFFYDGVSYRYYHYDFCVDVFDVDHKNETLIWTLISLYILFTLPLIELKPLFLYWHYRAKCPILPQV